MTKNNWRARLFFGSFKQKGEQLSVSTTIKSSVSNANKLSSSAFKLVAKPVVKLLLPYNDRWIVRNLANIISTLRLPLSLLLIFGMVYPAYVNQQKQDLYLALGLMLIVLLSDGFDGALARGLAAESRYGKAVDPVADKVFYVSSIVCLLLGAWNLVPREIVVVMLICIIAAVYFEIRLIMIAIATDNECRKRNTAEPVGANMWGKAKFFLQATAGFMGFGIPWVLAGFALAMCFVVLSLPMAYMSLRGHQLDLDAIKAKP